MVPLGSTAPDFDLPSVEGHSVSMSDFADAPALLVAFLSNRCPYVVHIEKQFAAVAAEYRERGLATVGICSSETDGHPEDAPEHLAEQARRAGFGFPYLVDESQETAKAYRAACTPDLFLYDAERRLAYRGRFDASRPGNDHAVDGGSLRAAVDLVLAGEAVPQPHTPSGGCNIKWRPGNEPS
ncbi:thioredoxin family protein [Thermomonospora umbrina]|nr:thioredoxin family protein [Thermomonospora umbrina]